MLGSPSELKIRTGSPYPATINFRLSQDLGNNQFSEDGKSISGSHLHGAHLDNMASRPRSQKDRSAHSCIETERSSSMSNSMSTSPGMPARRCSSQSPFSVALIDDDAGQLNFLKAQFANLGAAVTTFASGLEFLNRGCSPQENVICW